MKFWIQFRIRFLSVSSPAFVIASPAFLNVESGFFSCSSPGFILVRVFTESGSESESGPVRISKYAQCDSQLQFDLCLA
jgi:hypothetical protein